MTMPTTEVERDALGNTLVETPGAPVATAPPTYHEALLAVQGEVHGLGLGMDAEGQVQSRTVKYLTLAKLLGAVRPLLTKNGLVWSTFPTTLDGKPALRYRMLHAATGEFDEGTVLLMMDKGNTSQAQGSAITYARRYVLLAVLELTPDKDDDGAAASQPPRPAPVDPERAMDEDEVNRMLEAISEQGWAVEKVYERVGLKAGDAPLILHGRRVKKLIDEAPAKAGEGS